MNKILNYIKNLLNSFFSFFKKKKSNNIDENVILLKDIIYSEAYINDGSSKKSLYLDVYLNKESKLKTDNKSILIVHGGGFDDGSKDDSNIVNLANYLAKNNYVCFVINYRLKKDNPPVPVFYKISESGPAIHAAAVDVKSALRFITANSKNYGLDLDKINILGESAGSVASFAAALSEDYHFYKDKKSLPVLENNLNVNFKVKTIINLWGSAYLVGNKFSNNTPPIMTVHGEKDKKLGVSYSAALFIDKKCKEFNTIHQFYSVLKAGHGVWDYKTNGKDLSELIYNFLERFNNN